MTEAKSGFKFDINAVLFMLFIMYKSNMLTQQKLKTILKLIRESEKVDVLKYLNEEVDRDTHAARVEPPAEKKSVKYDPMYDPPPPIAKNVPPERIDYGKVIARKGFACVCEACKKVQYIVNKDISDNCIVAIFRRSFTPVEGVNELPETAEILNIDGTISTDCPSCGSNKALYLTRCT